MNDARRSVIPRKPRHHSPFVHDVGWNKAFHVTKKDWTVPVCQDDDAGDAFIMRDRADDLRRQTNSLLLARRDILMVSPVGFLMFAESYCLIKLTHNGVPRWCAQSLKYYRPWYGGQRRITTLPCWFSTIISPLQHDEVDNWADSIFEANTWFIEEHMNKVDHTLPMLYDGGLSL